MKFRTNRESFVIDEGDSRLTFWVASDGELLVNIYKSIDEVSYTSVTHAVEVPKALALRDYLNTVLPVPFALRED